MTRIVFIATAALFLVGCSPVLNRDIMKQGTREFSLASLCETPQAFEGKLFIFGGFIYRTRLLEQGSQIEAVFVPVDSRGNLKTEAHREGRFLAAYPKSKGVLDPLIYKQGRKITLAGEFVGTRQGRIEKMECVYPLFDIKEIYLWEEEKFFWPGYPYEHHNLPWYDPPARPYPLW